MPVIGIDLGAPNSAHAVLRLRDKACPSSAGRGDLFLRIAVKIPEKLSAREKALYDQLRALDQQHR